MLNRKVGPLPVWAWLVVGALAWWIIWRADRQGSAGLGVGVSFGRSGIAPTRVARWEPTPGAADEADEGGAGDEARPAFSRMGRLSQPGPSARATTSRQAMPAGSTQVSTGIIRFVPSHLPGGGGSAVVAPWRGGTPHVVGGR